MKKIYFLILVILVLNNCIWSQIPVIKFKIMYLLKNDTVSMYSIYKSKIGTDSLVCLDVFSKLYKNRWIGTVQSDGSYSIKKFKKLKLSKFLNKKKDVLYYADFECKLKYSKTFFLDGGVTIMRKIWMLTYMKNKPPK